MSSYGPENRDGVCEKLLKALFVNVRVRFEDLKLLLRALVKGASLGA